MWGVTTESWEGSAEGLRCAGAFELTSSSSLGGTWGARNAGGVARAQEGEKSRVVQAEGEEPGGSSGDPGGLGQP